MVNYISNLVSNISLESKGRKLAVVIISLIYCYVHPLLICSPLIAIYKYIPVGVLSLICGILWIVWSVVILAGLCVVVSLYSKI